MNGKDESARKCRSCPGKVTGSTSSNERRNTECQPSRRIASSRAGPVMEINAVAVGGDIFSAWRWLTKCTRFVGDAKDYS